ncbi:MAG: metal-sulfur cluster assembly factor [Trueperaceae bacterium]
MNASETLVHGVVVTHAPDTVDPIAVVEALRGVIDPELGVNVVDLGLVYGVRLTLAAQAGRGDEGDPRCGTTRAHVAMTLTTPGCPLHAVIRDDARVRLARLPEVGPVDVELTFDPPWSPERICPEGRVALGWDVPSDTVLERLPLPNA